MMEMKQLTSSSLPYIKVTVNVNEILLEMFYVIKLLWSHSTATKRYLKGILTVSVPIREAGLAMNTHSIVSGS